MIKDNSKIISVYLILVFCLLSSCSPYSRSLKEAELLGRYKTSYVKDNNISSDSIWLQIGLYNLETSQPMDFNEAQFSLNEYPNKVIEGNLCKAYFARGNVPTRIYIRLHKQNKYPLRIYPKLKKGKQIIYEVYLADDQDGII